ncbi:uncharacterized protein EV422DRAFT_236550 [Fimicolochytrium jonesii]|uniref:uncharacterized protein n=1 Tax=Fimicolochytrium jonesii TaxID=1396493 RepID=UPI0022FEB8FF|nr:uncharacterized protein EV422DRAFT_236550 [Fimicolochytrium jonesii]KAI8824881.1 hypothetical protein EV422DRAFT_236550 [Fimicolochytrium jonesii]
MAPLLLTVTPEHGYALGVAAASALTLQWLAFKVGGARKAANVPYPYMYAERSEIDKDVEKDVKKNKKHIFNCTQRAHQNTLEVYPVFLVLYATTALTQPLYASVCGATWVVSRVLYATGYATGDPKKRLRGSFGYLGLLGLLGGAAKVVYDLVV